MTKNDEIPVTPEMLQAGSVAFIESHGMLAAIYRAMRALEPDGDDDWTPESEDNLR